MLDPRLKNELFMQENTTPALREQYEKELKKIMEKELSTPKRIAFIASGILGICFFIGFGIVAFITREELPALATLGFVIGSLFGLGWSIGCYRIVRAGKMDLKKDPAILVGMMWIMLVFMVTIYLMLGNSMENAAQGTRMIASSLVFLIMGVVFMIQRFVESAQLDIKEHLLKLELQVSELQEKIENRK